MKSAKRHGMLSITRREDQTFTIGDDITITVKRARSGQVELGIQAPRDVKVLRDDAKKRE
jgi:carbon storage regulator